MNKPFKASFALLCIAVLSLSACFSRSVSSNYPNIVGSDFVTRKDMTLWKMHEYQYRFVPFELTNSNPGELADRIRTVPGGTRIHVVDAKFAPSIDAGFDYLIADLYLADNPAPIRFEQIVGDKHDSAYGPRNWKKIE
jgi:hypothetical protein